VPRRRLPGRDAAAGGCARAPRGSGNRCRVPATASITISTISLHTARRVPVTLARLPKGPMLRIHVSEPPKQLNNERKTRWQLCVKSHSTVRGYRQVYDLSKYTRRACRTRAANTADPDLRSRTAVKQTTSRLTADGNQSAHPS